MSPNSACPVRSLDEVAQAKGHYECVMCGYKWPVVEAQEVVARRVVKDANGNMLTTGDDVVLIKDLKLAGRSATLKGGTKIKKIRIVDGDHEVDCKVDCKVDGVGVMLKACFLKKA